MHTDFVILVRLFLHSAFPTLAHAKQLLDREHEAAAAAEKKVLRRSLLQKNILSRYRHNHFNFANADGWEFYFLEPTSQVQPAV